MACLYLMFIWNYISNLNNGLWNYYLLNTVHFPYSTISTASALYPLIIRAPWEWMHSLARLILLIPCGIVQTIVFFIAQKLLLPPDPELVEEGKAKADARAAAKE